MKMRKGINEGICWNSQSSLKRFIAQQKHFFLSAFSVYDDDYVFTINSLGEKIVNLFDDVILRVEKSFLRVKGKRNFSRFKILRVRARLKFFYFFKKR